jgi:hypothetical protein
MKFNLFVIALAIASMAFFLHGWYDCSQKGGSYMKNVFGFYQCVKVIK